MNPVVNSLNDIFSQWKQQYDLFSHIHSVFQINEAGQLAFDAFPLCNASSDLQLETAEFDAERIQFFFTDHRSIFLDVVWPEDLPPKISSVGFVYIMTEPLM